jgi:hypothetical protein
MLGRFLLDKLVLRCSSLTSQDISVLSWFISNKLITKQIGYQLADILLRNILFDFGAFDLEHAFAWLL